MKRSIYVIAAGLLFTLNLGLADSEKTVAGPAFTDPNKAILVNRDHPEFSIILKSNPTTGYRWVLRHYNRHLLHLVGEKYYAPNARMVGAPGYVTFNFRARKAAFLASQKTQIMLEYIRPWEAKSTCQQRTSVSVVTSY